MQAVKCQAQRDRCWTKQPAAAAFNMKKIFGTICGFLSKWGFFSPILINAGVIRVIFWCSPLITAFLPSKIITCNFQPLLILKGIFIWIWGSTDGTKGEIIRLFIYKLPRRVQHSGYYLKLQRWKASCSCQAADVPLAHIQPCTWGPHRAEGALSALGSVSGCREPGVAVE